MPFSIRLSRSDEKLLEAASRRTSRPRSELARDAIREFCMRLVRPGKSPWELGKNLFGKGDLAPMPKDPLKRALREKLNAKHRRVG